MITKEQFFKFIENWNIYNNAIERMSEAICGKTYNYFIYESDWNLAFEYIIDIFISSHFTEEGSDLIYWWKYEDVPKIIYDKIDKDIFHEEKTIEISVEKLDDLWKYISKNKKIYLKDA